MKKVLFFLTMMAIVFTMNAQRQFQSAGSTHHQPFAEPNRNSTWISWASSIDDGVITTAYMDNIIFAQRFTPSDLAPYNGFQLTQIGFYVENSYDYPPSGSYAIKVYQGGSYASSTSMNPGTLVYSQAVPYVTYDDLTYVTLNTPITIDASQELWFGVEVTNIAGYSYMLGFDNTSAVTGKGSLYYDSDDMTWYDINAVADLGVSAWDIEAYVVDPNGENDAIIDLGLWYIDNGDDQNDITDLTVPYGSDFALVPVVWNYNYAEATNNFYDTLHFEMTFDGTAIGNTGTTATSINTGAGVFWNNFTVFDASEIAYYNLYGTHTFCMTVSTGPGWYENDPSDNTGCITVTFEGPAATTDHTITVVNTDGSVTPNGSVTVSEGGTQLFNINVPACSYLQDVLVDGASVISSVTNNTYTFTNVTADHTFEVVYGAVTYTLNTSTDGHGTITPDHETVNCGDGRVFTITPDAGYEINYVTDNTMDVTANVVNNTYTLTNIQLNHSIYVAFTQSGTPADTYTVSASSDGHATITPASTTVNAGGTVTLNIVVDNGYEIQYVTDNTMDVTANVSNGSYTLSNINANHNIYVACQMTENPDTTGVTYTVSASSDGHATITPANTTVNAGGTVTLNIVVDNGYEIQYVTDNTMDVTANVSNGTYTLANINANHNIFVACQVTENPDTTSTTYTVTANSDGHATITPANTTVNAGGTVTLNIVVDNGYEIQCVTDNTMDVTANVSNGTYTLANINADHNIFVACQMTENPDTTDITDTTDLIQDYAAMSVKIFPNPAIDVVNFTSESAIDYILIYDNMGKLIINQEVKDTHAAISLAERASGIYLVKILSGAQIHTAKIIKH